MTHQPAAPGPVPQAGQAPYPAHPAPRTDHDRGVAANKQAEMAAVIKQTPIPPARGGASRIWLAVAATGVGLAVAAALIPLLHRPEPPKRPKGKKAHRRRK